MRAVGVFFLAAIATLASAKAEPLHFLKLKPDPLWPGTAGIDLVVLVSPEDLAWRRTEATATITGSPVFFEHPLGGLTAPDPLLFTGNPYLEWDSFYTSPIAYPNTPTQGEAPYVIGPHPGPKSSTAQWGLEPPPGGPGSYVIARYTLIDLEPGWSFSVEGVSFTEGSVNAYPFSLHIPEPHLGAAGFALLVTTLIRRERSRPCTR